MEEELLPSSLEFSPLQQLCSLVLCPGNMNGWNQGRDKILCLAQSNSFSLILECENLSKDKVSYFLSFPTLSYLVLPILLAASQYSSNNLFFPQVCRIIGNAFIRKLFARTISSMNPFWVLFYQCLNKGSMSKCQRV